MSNFGYQRHFMEDKAIRNVKTGKIVRQSDVGNPPYDTPEKRLRVLQNMVDGHTWVWTDEEITISASEAPKYLNDKLKELQEKEAEIEQKAQELNTRFKEVVEKEIAYETRVDELNKREAALVEKEGAKTQKGK